MRERQGVKAAQSVSVEGLQDEGGMLGRGEGEMDVEEGGMLLEEEQNFEECNSPVMMPPGSQ